MVIKSWESDAVLEELARKQREKEIVNGVIRSIKSMKFPKVDDKGKVQSLTQKALNVALPGGVTGYCPVSDFKQRKFKSYDQFVSLKDQFVITQLDLENNIAILSGVEAEKRLQDELFTELEALEESGKLKDTKFTGRITGYNQQKGIVYVRLSGQDAFIFRSEWSWADRVIVDAVVGQEIEVVVQQFDREGERIKVSRRLAIPDPYEYLYTLEKGQTIAGRVSSVDPIEGLFVEVETDVELKASKLKTLEEPIVGDRVRCSVVSISPEKRRGRVLIVAYPDGKQTNKDIGSFLFDGN